MYFRRSVAVLIIALVAACSSEAGRNFDLTKADQFRPGVTTYDEAVSQLGKPTTLRRYPDGRFGAAWQYSKGTLSGGSAKGVGIVFSASGVMERMSGRVDVEPGPK